MAACNVAACLGVSEHIEKGGESWENGIKSEVPLFLNVNPSVSTNVPQVCKMFTLRKRRSRIIIKQKEDKPARRPTWPRSQVKVTSCGLLCSEAGTMTSLVWLETTGFVNRACKRGQIF